MSVISTPNHIAYTLHMVWMQFQTGFSMNFQISSQKSNSIQNMTEVVLLPCNISILKQTTLDLKQIKPTVIILQTLETTAAT